MPIGNLRLSPKILASGPYRMSSDTVLVLKAGKDNALLTTLVGWSIKLAQPSRGPRTGKRRSIHISNRAHELDLIGRAQLTSSVL